MKINSVNYNLKKTHFTSQNFSKNKYNNVKISIINSSDNVSFRANTGKFIGGILGAGIAGIGTLALLANPITLAGAIALTVAETGGAVIGASIGNKKSKNQDTD